MRVTEIYRVVPYHSLTPAGPIPSACDPDGVYPYVSFTHTSPPSLRRLRFISLENGALRVEICPDLGGKATALFAKAPDGREVTVLAHRGAPRAHPAAQRLYGRRH